MNTSPSPPSPRIPSMPTSRPDRSSLPPTRAVVSETLVPSVSRSVSSVNLPRSEAVTFRDWPSRLLSRASLPPSRPLPLPAWSSLPRLLSSSTPNRPCQRKNRPLTMIPIVNSTSRWLWKGCSEGLKVIHFHCIIFPEYA